MISLTNVDIICLTTMICITILILYGYNHIFQSILIMIIFQYLLCKEVLKKRKQKVM